MFCHVCTGEQTTPIILVEEEADDEAVHSVRFAPDCCHVVVCKGHRALVYNREVRERVAEERRVWQKHRGRVWQRKGA